jgi:hypothetical protein
MTNTPRRPARPDKVPRTSERVGARMPQGVGQDHAAAVDKATAPHQTCASGGIVVLESR